MHTASDDTISVNFFSNFELGKVYMHPCLLVSVVYWQTGGVSMYRQDGENGVTWAVEPVT